MVSKDSEPVTETKCFSTVGESMQYKGMSWRMGLNLDGSLVWSNIERR